MVSVALTNLDRFTNSYFIEKHMIEEALKALKALKERHLIAKGVSPGMCDYNNSSAEGATPNYICATHSALIMFYSNTEFTEQTKRFSFFSYF